jgi:phosphoribosyl-ATP pyrophosphohydrolase/phosphoribosyl-AMP cyclohydrolase
VNHSDIGFLSQLELIVNDRMEDPSEESYTARLVKSGRKRIAQKVGEEGVELAIAAVAGDDDDVLNEAADLVYHMIVLLADCGLTLGGVSDRLQTRHSS